MSADELKAAIREYATENLPGWTFAGVTFQLGSMTSGMDETLLVLPSRASQSLPALRLLSEPDASGARRGETG